MSLKMDARFPRGTLLACLMALTIGACKTSASGTKSEDAGASPTTAGIPGGVQTKAKNLKGHLTPAFWFHNRVTAFYQQCDKWSDKDVCQGLFKGFAGALNQATKGGSSDLDLGVFLESTATAIYAFMEVHAGDLDDAETSALENFSNDISALIDTYLSPQPQASASQFNAKCQSTACKAIGQRFDGYLKAQQFTDDQALQPSVFLVPLQAVAMHEREALTGRKEGYDGLTAAEATAAKAMLDEFDQVFSAKDLQRRTLLHVK